MPRFRRRFQLVLALILVLSSNAWAIGTTDEPTAACCSDTIDGWEFSHKVTYDNLSTGENDIWSRISSQLEFKRDLHRAPVLNELNELLQHLPSLFQTMERSQPYLYYVIEQVEKRNLPIELALIPFIESQFDPRATSIYNASGLWQFMPATAQHFEITDNWWFDGRRDVLESTNAALEYLESLVRYFDGDWLLAIAAYNGGPARVKKQVKDFESRGLPANYWSLDLPRETRKYVPSLLALAEIISWGKVNGRDLPNIDNKRHLHVVQLAGQSDLLQIAKLADMTTEDFYHFNPGMLRWGTPPNGPHRVVIPSTNIDDFNANYSKPEHRSKTLIDWHTYLVREGDTVQTIADLFGVSVATLIQLNDLDSTRIQANKYMLVPLDERRPEIARGGSHKYLSDGTVTLNDLARRYEIPVERLLDNNSHIKSATTVIAKELVVDIVLGDTIPDSSKTPETVRYRIRPGDTLSSIAARLGTTVTNLMAMNNLTSSILYPGKTINIPLDKNPH